MAKQTTLEARRAMAEQIVAKMNEQLMSINAVLKNANAILTKIDKKDKEYQKLNNTLLSINATTKVAIKSFDADQRKIKAKLSEANRFYDEKFVPVAKKVNDPQRGLPIILKTIQKDYEAYKIVKEKCVAKFDEIANAAKECRAKSKELAGIEKAIIKFHKNAEASTFQIGELLIAAGKTNTTINQIHKDLTILHETSKKSAKNIETLEGESKSLNADIAEYHRISDENKKAIEKIYGIAHETGLSGEFEKRRNTLGNEIRKWEKFVLWTSVALLAGVIMLFVGQLWANKWEFDDVFDLNFYVRFLVFSPVVYYLYFVSTQYNKAKKLHDKYAFKTTLAMVIKSHIELLTQHGYFDEDGQCNKILDFILKGFGKIYNEPYTDDNYKMKIKLANFEIDMQQKIIDKLGEITGYESGNNAIQTVIESK